MEPSPNIVKVGAKCRRHLYLQGHTGITSLLLDRPELVLGHDLSSVTAADLAEAGEAAWRHTIDAIDPLHVAAAKGQVEVVKRLIRCVR